MDVNQEQEIGRGLKLLAKSSLVVFVTMGFSKIFIYLYRIIIARYYGPEVYGLFVLSIVWVSFFRVFSGLGLKEGLLRYISIFKEKKEKNKIPYLLRFSVFMSIFTSVFAGILLFAFSDFIALKIFQNPDLIIFLKIFSITIPFTVLGGIFLSVIRAYEKIGWFSFISNILGNFIELIVLVFLVLLGVNSNSVSVSYLIGIFFIFITAYVFTRVSIPKVFVLNRKANTFKDKKSFKEMFSYSWPFIFYGVVTFVFYWIDSFMIGILRTADDVGFYNSAVPIVSLLALPLSLFGQLFFPLVAKQYSKGYTEVVRQLSKQVSKWIFILVVPFFILLLIFPGAFINILFGEEYLVAENALRFLAVGALFSSLFGISQELLFIKGKSKLILIDMTSAAIINIILNLLLIPSYGITGAGFATMLSLIILSLLFAFQSYKHLSIVPLRKKMINISLMAIFSTILLIIVKSFVEINLLSLILSGTFFIVFYFFLVLTTNCLDKNDWDIIKAVVRKSKLDKYFKVKRLD